MNAKQKIKKLEAEIKSLKQLNAQLIEQIALLKRALFGKSSETLPNKNEGEAGSDEAGSDEAGSDEAGSDEAGSDEAEGSKPEISETDQKKIEEAKKLRSRARSILRDVDQKLSKGRSKNKSNIEIDSVRLRVPDGLYCNSCSSTVKDQGPAFTASEIDYIKARIIERTFKLHRGECRCGQVSFTMPPPERGLERTKYSPGLIAWVTAQKFRYFFPVHRLEQFLDDNGLFISRQTLNGLVNRAAAAIDGVASRIREINKQQDVIQVDETTVCVVLGESKRYYLWCTMTQKGIAFRITERRNRAEAKETVGTQAEAVLSDGLNVYGGEVIQGTHANCLAHLRRMFFNSIMSCPLEAMRVLDIIVELYKIEALAKEEGLDEAELLALRQSRSKSLMNDLKAYIDTLKAPPRSSLGKAIKYAKKRWKELSAFLSDPRLEIDNNGVEREFKMAKLGLKNFLFCQSEIGCDALANFYTLIATCKLHGVDFESYLTDILVKIEGGWSQSKIDELLPWNWKPPAPTSQHQPTGPDHCRVENMDLDELIRRRGLERLVHQRADSVSPIAVGSDPPG